MKVTTYIRVSPGATGSGLLKATDKRDASPLAGIVRGRMQPVSTVGFELTVDVPDEVFDGAHPLVPVQAPGQTIELLIEEVTEHAAS